VKKIICSFVVIALLLTGTAYSQNFEGKIVYQNTFKSKVNGLTDEQLSSMMGTLETYLTNGVTYKNTTNGTLILWQLYVPKDNKVYNKISNSDTLYWDDAGVNDDSVIKTELNKNVTEILGYQCDELVLTCKSGVQKYYFNSKIVADSKAFAKHKYGNWYDYLKNANALPLKSIIESDQFLLTSTATEVTPMKIDSKEFKLPEGALTAKSPY
jgi:hypothetical protein